MIILFLYWGYTVTFTTVLTIDEFNPSIILLYFALPSFLY
jgi:hypothetical protein